jgi:hypothetical protein
VPLKHHARQGGEDGRFLGYQGTVQSVVTGGASSDSGMFETNLRDERFLPFEGCGAIGTWRLELLRMYRQFDYGTISDVVLTLRYTARAQVMGTDRLTRSRRSKDRASSFVEISSKAPIADRHAIGHIFGGGLGLFLPLDAHTYGLPMRPLPLARARCITR